MNQSIQQLTTNSYESMNDLTRVPRSQPEPEVAYYLSHHGVFRENSSTTKLRVVFNGSSRTTTGISLMIFFTLVPNCRLMSSKYSFGSDNSDTFFLVDIEKMYRQIKVHPDDWDFQRILWMDQNQEISTYQLSTITYRLACASFLALRTLAQLVEDESAKFPLAIPSLTKGRYVDDIFGGADSINQTQEIIFQLISLCKAGGFPLQKWTSNNQNTLDVISPERHDNLTPVHFNEATTVHILGLCWNSLTDSLQFSSTCVPPTIITKRRILSTIAKIFDPLGLLAPIIITAKIFIQQLWSMKLGWDDHLPLPSTRGWTHFTEHLKDITTLTFPRWIDFKSGQDIEIHGFCDASQLAICATVYIRASSQREKFKTHLLFAKTKVAPLKKMTIPLLELTGAVILTKLVSRVLQILELNQVPVLMWTDSAIVHTWINNHPSRWKDFVHNRVCYIHEGLPQAIWRMIPGIENLADCGTRGMTPSQLLQHTIW